MICWMFPGQPLRRDYQFPASTGSDDIRALCLETTGFDPVDWNDTGSLASEHVRLQLYGTAASISRSRYLWSENQRPDIVLEHSLGIYAALAACGSIRDRDALEITARVGTALAGMSRDSSYALGCIVGLDREPLEEAVTNHGVYVANYNTRSHHLLAGEYQRIVSVMEECTAAGAFSVSLFDCDAPLHTPLLEEAAGTLQGVFSDYHYNEPTVPLLNHIDQQRLSASRIADFLLEELLNPVWWLSSYSAARALGASKFVEVGSGDALKKFNRWIDSQGGGMTPEVIQQGRRFNPRPPT